MISCTQDNPSSSSHPSSATNPAFFLVKQLNHKRNNCLRYNVLLGIRTTTSLLSSSVFGMTKISRHFKVKTCILSWADRHDLDKPLEMWLSFQVKACDCKPSIFTNSTCEIHIQFHM